MHATDRVVLVASGFGIWQGGRHGASARWTDVARVRVLQRDALVTNLVIIAVTLRDGTEVLLREGVPGFEEFLAAAERALPGMRARTSWRQAATEPGVAGNETVLFDRPRGKSRGFTG